MLNFFEANNLLPESQHGFRGKRSTFSAVATMHELWIKNLEKKENQSLTFLDLSAAFDLVPTEILLKKLEIYGLELDFLEWIKSYLTGMQQCVWIDHTTYSFLPCEVGVP